MRVGRCWHWGAGPGGDWITAAAVQPPFPHMPAAHPARPPCSLSTRGSELQDELRSSRAEAEAEAAARQAAEAAATRALQDQRAAAEQLEAARRGRAEAVGEAAELQGRVAELEASAALYIAKEARLRREAVGVAGEGWLDGWSARNPGRPLPRPPGSALHAPPHDAPSSHPPAYTLHYTLHYRPTMTT